MDDPQDAGRILARVSFETRVPDSELPDAEVPPEIFAAMLSAFGPMPQDGRRDLTRCIKNVREDYKFRRKIKEQNFPLPYEEWDRLERISTSLRGALKLTRPRLHTF
jgi:hypothetical protein